MGYRKQTGIRLAVDYLSTASITLPWNLAGPVTVHHLKLWCKTTLGSVMCIPLSIATICFKFSDLRVVLWQLCVGYYRYTEIRIEALALHSSEWEWGKRRSCPLWQKILNKFCQSSQTHDADRFMGNALINTVLDWIIWYSEDIAFVEERCDSRMHNQFLCIFLWEGLCTLSPTEEMSSLHAEIFIKWHDWISNC